MYARWRGWTFEGEDDEFSHHDALMYEDGFVVEVAECKGRGDYSTLMDEPAPNAKTPVNHDKYAGRSYLREDKRQHLLDIAKDHGVRAMALFDYADGLFFIPVDEVPLNDRFWQENANDGACWVYRFPASLLTRLPEEQPEDSSEQREQEEEELGPVAPAAHDWLFD